MRGIRNTLLRVYKLLVAVTGLLPAPVRSRVDSWSSFVLLRVGNTPDSVIEACLTDALQVLAATERPDELGDYLEFGVCFGSSMACMHRVLDRQGIRHVRLFGFDSFEGLPDAARTDDGGYWSPRMFKADIRMTRRFLARARVDWDRVILVKGWFSDTLNDGLVERHRLRKASVIMIDCDMYLSARQALDFCGPLIQEQAVIIFDDWYSGGLDERNMGERRAFEEFMEGGEFEAEPLGRYAPNARFFKVSRRAASRRPTGSAFPRQVEHGA